MRESKDSRTKIVLKGELAVISQLKQIQEISTRTSLSCSLPPETKSARKLRSRRARRGKLRCWRYFYWQAIRSRDKSESIARSIAIGVFSGFLPVVGLQFSVAIALAFLLKANKILAAAATWVSNPFTYVPIYMLNFQIGRWLLQTHAQTQGRITIQSWQVFRELGTELVQALLLGSLVMGAISALASYCLCLWLISYLRNFYHTKRLQGKAKSLPRSRHNER